MDRKVTKIIITGDIELKGNQLYLACSRCGKQKHIEHFGFRFMEGHGSTVRNQPRCSLCRSQARPDPNQVTLKW